MKIGLQLGDKLFIGYESAKVGSILQPFTENVESGMPYVVAGTDFETMLSILKGEYSDSNLIELFSCISEIYSPINDISSRAVSCEFQFRRIKDDEPVNDNDNLNRILTEPNPLQNFQELFAEAINYYYVTGKSYMLFNIPSTINVFDYKYVTSIYNLPSDRITPEIEDQIKLFSATEVKDVIKGYTLEKGGRNEKTFKTNKVLYTKAPNLKWSGKKIEGRSPILSAEKAVRNLIAVYEARGVIYIKRGALGMWVSRKKDDSGVVSLTKSEKLEAAKDMDSMYGLVGKKKQTAGITSAPIDFVRSQMSIQELQPFEETMSDAAAIYGACKVPFELAPKIQKETYANQQTAERSLYYNIVIPLVKARCQSITNFLKLREIGIYLDADFSKVEVLQENKKEESDRNKNNTLTYLTQFLSGILTLNQWMSQHGYEGSKNSLYDKLIYDMSPEELEKVKQIINLKGKPNVETSKEDSNEDSKMGS